MAKCETSGKDYDKALKVIAAEKSSTLDSFECAIHTLASTGPQCGCQIVGHGVENQERSFAMPIALLRAEN